MLAGARSRRQIGGFVLRSVTLRLMMLFAASVFGFVAMPRFLPRP